MRSADISSSENDGNPTVLGSPIANTNPALPVDPTTGLRLTSAGEYNLVIAPSRGLPSDFTTANYFLGDEPYTSLGSQHEGGELDLWGLSLVVNWDFGAASLKSITYYRDMESSDGRDEDNSDVDPISFIRDRMDNDQWSQEFQLSGQAFDERMDWTTGIYYFEDDTFNPNPVDFPFFDRVSGSIVEKTSAAIFGQATYAFSDRWSGTFGVRYTDEDKDFTVDPRIQFVTRIWVLGRNNPFGIAAGALLIGFLDRSSQILDLEGIPKEIVVIMEGVIVLSVVIAYEVVERIAERREQQQTAESIDDPNEPAGVES